MQQPEQMDPGGIDSQVILCFTDWTRSQIAVATGILDGDSAKAAVMTPEQQVLSEVPRWGL